MHINHQAFTRNQQKLSYQVIGKGSTPLIAFTGFGKSSSELAEKLKKTSLLEKYQIFCFDFFFHGESYYPKERINRKQIDKKEFCDFVKAFAKEKEIKKIDLLGYSLGGKLALILLECAPELFNNCYLLAPDGLKKVWWYRVLLNFPPFRWVYSYYIKNPYWYFWWIKAINKLGFIHKKAANFAIIQMDSEFKRQRTYDVWMIMKKLEPDYKELSGIKNLNKRLHLFVGRHDRIIRPWKGESFLNKINLQVQENLTVLECGHDLLKQEILTNIANEVIKKGA